MLRHTHAHLHACRHRNLIHRLLYRRRPSRSHLSLGTFFCWLALHCMDPSDLYLKYSKHARTHTQARKHRCETWLVYWSQFFFHWARRKKYKSNSVTLIWVYNSLKRSFLGMKSITLSISYEEFGGPPVIHFDIKLDTLMFITPSAMN